MDIGYLPTVVADEVWSNPYLTGERRKTTDRRGNAYRFKASNLWGSALSFDMAFATTEIEDEKIADPALQRDSDTYFFKGQYRTMVSE